ncbi:hypothetical protein Pyn_05859 [Prunus yedoensis var. nudiflora]|uniref:Uncharacterized protein n=1 Tax=Prunus yedoensis var. nudiflora TaxID=2094558 RepID=A0A314UDQ5_PRUYE|nr:hypothetical protein Pyn_05859 [Prunus yedoensis var. nudiflora]
MVMIHKSINTYRRLLRRLGNHEINSSSSHQESGSPTEWPPKYTKVGFSPRNTTHANSIIEVLQSATNKADLYGKTFRHRQRQEVNRLKEPSKYSLEHIDEEQSIASCIGKNVMIFKMLDDHFRDLKVITFTK